MKINNKKSKVVVGAIVAIGGLPAFAAGQPDKVPTDIKSKIEEVRLGQENTITNVIQNKFPQENIDFKTIQYHEETETVDLSTFDGVAVTVPVFELQEHSPNGER